MLWGCSPAEAGSGMCLGLCGGGCRAGSGKAKLIPLPQEMRKVPSQEFRDEFLTKQIFPILAYIKAREAGVLKLNDSFLLSVLFGGKIGWYLHTGFQVEFLFLFLLCSIGSHCLSSDQIPLFLLSASSARAGLWQSRLWILFLAWSQGDAEKLTYEATAVNGITAPLGTTLASLSFPLHLFLIFLLSSSQYLNWFVCFVLLSLSPHHHQQMKLFLFILQFFAP